MAHEIYMTMPSRIVLNKDTEFEVWSHGNKLGTLKISKGTIEWAPANYSYGYHLSWEKFDEIMQRDGRQ
jgi:hypothetical protein